MSGFLVPFEQPETGIKQNTDPSKQTRRLSTAHLAFSTCLKTARSTGRWSFICLLGASCFWKLVLLCQREPKSLGFDSVTVLFNHRCFLKNKPFSLGFLRFSRKKDPWKEWEGTPGNSKTIVLGSAKAHLSRTANLVEASKQTTFAVANFRGHAHRFRRSCRSGFAAIYMD